MDDDRLRDHSRSVQRERNLESALLANLVEAHPEPLTEPELVREMSAISVADGRPAVVREALQELIEVGLVRRRGAALEPTPASLRSSELELGL